MLNFLKKNIKRKENLVFKSHKNLAPLNNQTEWIKPGKSINIAGYNISSGMIYVGTELLTESSYYHNETDPCLINPKLKISKPQATYAIDELCYWPSYSNISSQARATYLEWLMNGRNDPTIDIAYVFIFFYGLERRVFIDLDKAGTDAVTELTIIAKEVERLLVLHSTNNSFRNYATSFLEICMLKSGMSLDKTIPKLNNIGYQIPLSLKITLARMVVACNPIPIDWLFYWYLHSTTARLRTPAIRCREEFYKLLQIKFAKKYGEGLVLKPNKRRLKAHYQPASSTFNNLTIDVKVESLPDITALKAPLNKLQVLIDECTNALDSYSRWLGRNSNNYNPIIAISLIPVELIKDFKNEEINQLRQIIERKLDNQTYQIITGNHILSWWSISETEKLVKKEATMLIRSFERLGYGIEPDIRYSGKAFKCEDKFILFRLTEDYIKSPSKSYLSAKIMLRLAVGIAKADNVFDISEQQYLEERLETTLALSNSECIRLRAYLAWLLQEKVSLRGIKTKLSKMTDDEKAEIANFLISVAGADGRICPKEISILSKIYPLLGFDSNEIYSHIHNFSTPISSNYSQIKPALEPVTIRRRSSIDPGFTIPVRPSKENPEEKIKIGFSLDINAVERKQNESAKVSMLLSNIFDEDEEDNRITVVSESQRLFKSESRVSELDSKHTEFLEMLTQQISWSRKDLEATATELNLLLDGALEVINDIAFDVCDEPLCDGEDPIEIDVNILEQLLL